MSLKGLGRPEQEAGCACRLGCPRAPGASCPVTDQTGVTLGGTSGSDHAFPAQDRGAALHGLPSPQRPPSSICLKEEAQKAGPHCASWEEAESPQLRFEKTFPETSFSDSHVSTWERTSQPMSNGLYFLGGSRVLTERKEGERGTTSATLK